MTWTPDTWVDVTRVARCYFKPCQLEATRYLHEAGSGHAYTQWCDFHMGQLLEWKERSRERREVPWEEFLLGTVLET